MKKKPKKKPQVSEKVNGEHKETVESEIFSVKEKEKTDGKIVVKEPTEEKDTPWHHGVCKWFNSSKGWGFVNLCNTVQTISTTSSDSLPSLPSGDVFVHQASILMTGFRSLAVGEEVEFQAVRREGRGWEAVAVRGVSGGEIRGQSKWPGGSRQKKVRCFNCGNFARHLAADCPHPPLPKRCHHCKVNWRSAKFLVFRRKINF